MALVVESSRFRRKQRRNRRASMEGLALGCSTKRTRWWLLIHTGSIRSTSLQTETIRLQRARSDNKIRMLMEVICHAERLSRVLTIRHQRVIVVRKIITTRVDHRLKQAVRSSLHRLRTRASPLTNPLVSRTSSRTRVIRLTGKRWVRSWTASCSYRRIMEGGTAMETIPITRTTRIRIVGGRF